VPRLGTDLRVRVRRGYLHEGGLGRSEVGDGLAPMLRFRWAAKADYFARRITENDLTGISGPDDNEKA
jgi:hypothetical protein